jgi:hypothetical protein
MADRAQAIVGLNTTNNLLTANLRLMAGVNNSLTVAASPATAGISDATKYVVFSSAVTGFTSTVPVSAPAISAALNVPADGVITIDPSLTVGTVALDNTANLKSYTVRVYDASGVDNATNYNDFNYVVLATRHANVVELGGLDNLTIAAGSGYKFVNFEMASSGPANLFPSIPAVKAAVNLTAGKDGLLLVEQATGNVTEATIQKYKPGLTFDVTVPQINADAQPNDQFGFKRAPLVVTSATVAGTYNMTFKVDTLELPITIVIKNPEPKLFVLSGIDSNATPANVLKVSLPSTNTGTTSPVKLDFGSKSQEFIKYFDTGNFPGNYDTAVDGASGDKFISSVNGVYTLEMPSTYASATAGLYGRIAIADMPLGVYNFKVVKTYPDGRIETVEDAAEITGHDDNGIAEFGTPTKLNVNNVKFEDKFLIAETEYTLGTYTYEFTFGTVNKKYTINVVKQPSLTVSSLAIGTTATQLFDGSYTLKPGTYGGNITMPFTLANLTTANFLSISTATTIASGFTAPVTTKQSLVGLNTLALGSLTSGARTKNDRIVYTVSFFNLVAFSAIPGVSGSSTAADRYIQVGESQVITVLFVDGVIPIITAATAATKVANTSIALTITSTIGGTVYAIAVDDEVTTIPTPVQIITQGTSYGSTVDILGKISGAITTNATEVVIVTDEAGELVTGIYDIYFVVVSESGISSVIKLDNVTLG